MSNSLCLGYAIRETRIAEPNVVVIGVIVGVINPALIIFAAVLDGQRRDAEMLQEWREVRS